jgi:hypothetical protein
MRKILLIAFIAGAFTTKALGFGDGMKVYPNPAKTGSIVKIEVETEILEVEVFDVTGKTVKIPVTIKENGSVEINTDGCAEGIYFIKIRTPKANMVSKLVVN